MAMRNRWLTGALLAGLGLGLTTGCEPAPQQTQQTLQATRAGGDTSPNSGSVAAQTRPGGGQPGGAQPGGGTTRAGGAKALKLHPNGKSGALHTKLDAKTKAEVQRRVTARWNQLSATEKDQLSQKMWGLYMALEDGPVPHVTPKPPADPPPREPCKDCGEKQQYPADPCAEKRKKLDELMEDSIMKGLIVDALHSLKQVLVDMEFYGGVADLVANIVSTTAGLVTAGTGAGFGRAAVNALAGIAVSEIQSAVTDAVADSLPAPLDAAVSGGLTMELIDSLLAAATAALKEANIKKMNAIIDINKCHRDYASQIQKTDALNQEVENCRRANPAYCL